MPKREKYNVAIVGATGAVGREILAILEERNFPVAELCLLASARSAGSELEFRGFPHKVQELTPTSFQGIDLALFSAGGAISLQYAPLAAKAGAVVVDNTSAFRMEADVPLVVPEVNPHAIAGYSQRGIIANPNCSTIQMVLVLKPLHDKAGLKRVIVSTYQSTSGAGKKAMNELEGQVRALMNQKEVKKKVFPHQIAFNCLPHIDVFLENGYTKEEMKMVEETQKIMELPELKVSATAVRVPVFCGHSEAVTIETQKKLTPEAARAILSKAPGIKVLDDPQENLYPLAIEAAGKDEAFVGRIREDLSSENGLVFWVVADNLRKGAALNAVQIAEILIEKYI